MRAWVNLVAIALLVATTIQQAAIAADQSKLQKAPAFTLANAAGESLSFPRDDNSGVDIYFFWATWCPYCKALMPHLQSILDEHGEQVRVYAMNIREDGDPQAYLESQGYDFMLMPEADKVAKMYGAMSTPGVFIIDQRGMVRMNPVSYTHLTLPTT